MRRSRPGALALWRLYLLTLPCVLVFVCLSWYLWLEPADHVWIDALMQRRPARPQDPRLVVVFITDETRQELSLGPNIPRSTYARYLRRVHELGARVQLVDIFLQSGYRDEAGENDVLAAVDEIGNKVAFIGVPVDTDRESELLVPLSEKLSRPRDHLAHAGWGADRLGRVRDVSLLFRPRRGVEYPHLGWAGVLLADPPVPADSVAPPRPWYLAYGSMVRVRDHWVPTFLPNAPGGRYSHRVFFDVPRALDERGLFETWKLEQLLPPETSTPGRVKYEFRPGYFRDKVVLLGTSESAQHDRFMTSVGPQLGPILNALVLTSLLDNSFLLPIGAHVVIALCVLVWALGVPLYARLSPLHAALGAVGIVVVLLSTGAALYFPQRLWLPVAAPVFVNVATYAVVAILNARRTEENRRFIRDTFSRYAPRQIVDQLMTDSASLRLGGEAQEVSILFADINGFTSITEMQGPHETIEMLNEYFARMTAVIFRHEGLIKQFVGDEIMVIFGAPIYREDHASRALATAWEMREETERLRAEREAAKKPGFDIKFGLNSGVVVLGNIGSPERMEYGAVGDVVNAASRIMGLNKQLEATTKILVGERTAELGGARWKLREVGTFSVRGKSQALRVYELAGEKVPSDRHREAASAVRTSVDP